MANYNDLGNVTKMVDKDIHLTVTDMSFGELTYANNTNNSSLTQVSNSLIISAPQVPNGNSGFKDRGDYALFATDYNGRLCTLTPFNRVDKEYFNIKKEESGSFEGSYVLSLNKNSILSEINSTVTRIDNELSELKNNHNNDINDINTKIGNLDNKLNRVISQLNSWENELRGIIESLHGGSGSTYVPDYNFGTAFNPSTINLSTNSETSSYNNTYENNVSWEYNF